MTAPDQSIVPFWRTQLGEEEAARVREAILSGRLSQGKDTEAFESRLAELLGVPYVLCTTSGSSALYLAVRALEIGPGDDVIVPDRTFIASAHAVLLAGAKVKLVDCRQDSTLVDVDAIENAIGPKTRAIMVVHLNGNAVDMSAVKAIAARRGLAVIEDAAQALGSSCPAGPLGSLGDIGCFSLGPTKLITTGQGGFVATKNQDLWRRMSLTRTHGVDSTFAADFQSFGFNLKFNDVAASIGLAQLERLTKKRTVHSEVYAFYREALSGIVGLDLLPVDERNGALPLWIEAVCPRRDEVIAALAARRIQARPFLRGLHESRHLENAGSFPHSNRFSDQGMFLPCGPDLAREGLERTAAALRQIMPAIGDGKTTRRTL